MIQTDQSNRSRRMPLLRWATLMLAVAVIFAAGRVVVAQGTSPAPATPPAATPPTAPAATPTTGSADAQPKVKLIDLFKESFDLFTILLVAGSLAGWTIIIICFIEVRKSVIAPDEPEQIIPGLIKAGRWADLRQFVGEDDALVSRAVGAALNHPGSERSGMRDAAELTASEECSRWFRRIEPLNVIGNLGPLLGLAGTVWGMIIAFAALGESGGQANPATLSLGISKALFHTLLGLMLAVPCLTVFGFYRTKVDRLCTRAMVAAGEMVEMLPEDARVRLGGGTTGTGGAGGANAGLPRPAPMPRPAAPAPKGT
jgi:biopolymer transport protein ExbB/TolQ